MELLSCFTFVSVRAFKKFEFVEYLSTFHSFQNNPQNYCLYFVLADWRVKNRSYIMTTLFKLFASCMRIVDYLLSICLARSCLKESFAAVQEVT